MTISTSFELSREEVLEAITRAINQEFRYSGYIQPGKALSLQSYNDGSTFRVKWGQEPELDLPEPDSIKAALAAIAPSVPEPVTMES